MSRNARPADCRVRAGVGDTRVSGASALLAEWASQKPFYGIRTRGSQRPDDSQGRGGHMEQEHGAFKENPPAGSDVAIESIEIVKVPRQRLA